MKSLLHLRISGLAVVCAGSLLAPLFGNAQTHSSADLVLQAGHTAKVNCVAFSLTGQYLASGSDDTTIRLWEVSTGRVYRVLTGDFGAITAVAFSPDSRILASASKDQTVKLWDVESGAERRTIKVGMTAEVLYFSADGKAVNAASKPEAGFSSALPVNRWDVTNGRKLEVTYRNATDTTSFNSDPNVLELVAANTGAFDSPMNVILRDGISGQEHPTALKTKSGEQGKELHILGVGPRGRLIALANTSDGSASVVEMDTGRPVLHLDAPPQTDDPVRFVIDHITFSPDERWLVTEESDSIRLWDARSGQLDRTLLSHMHGIRVNGIAFSKDGRYLAEASGDDPEERNFRLYSIQGGGERNLSGVTSQAIAMAISADGHFMASASTDGSVAIWDLRQGHVIHTIVYHGPEDDPDEAISFLALSFSPDGKRLAAVRDSNDETLVLFDPVDGKVVHTSGSGEGPDRNSDRILADAIKFLPGGRLVVTDGISVTLWSATTLKKIATLTGSSFAVGGRTLVTSGFDGGAIYDVLSGKKMRSFAKGGELMAVSPDDRWLAVGTGDGFVVVIDLNTGLKVREMLGHTGKVTALAFAGNGELVSGSSDDNIKFWNVRTGKELRNLAGHTDRITKLAFTADDRWLVSASDDGSERFWKPATGELTATLVSMHATMRASADWLVITPDGLFDGTADGMQQVAWRRSNPTELTSLDAFFTDFYHPGLLPEILAGGRPKAVVDIATILQVPGLRMMLTNKFVHPEIHDGQAVICFEQKPGAAINAGPNDQRVVFPPVNGYETGTTPTCRFQKKLPNAGANAVVLMKQLQNWKSEVITTPWDGKPSDTRQSTLHVLTVGVSQYPSNSGFDRLPYAVTSAHAIESFFKELGTRANKPYAAVRVWDGLYDTEATREKVRQRWADMVKSVGENDVVFLYLAGHGKVSPGQEMFYYIPVDGRDDDLLNTGVSTAIIAEALRSLPARRIVLIMDACQSGGAIEALSKIGVVKAQVEQQRTGEASKAPGREQGVGVHLIAATLPLSYAVGLKEGQSMLAEMLLKALQQGPGTITVDQVSAYIKAQLPGASEQVTRSFRQVPLINSIGLDFALTRAEQ